MNTTLRASLVFGASLALAGTLIGCVATNYTAVNQPTSVGPETINSSLTGDKQTMSRLVLNFSNSGYKTQAAGSHHTEIRFMYTSGCIQKYVSASSTASFYFGLKNGGTTTAPYNTINGLADADPAPTLNKTPWSLQLSAVNSELPIFQSEAATGDAATGSTVVPTATDSNYILPAGIWKNVVATSSVCDPFYPAATNDLDATYKSINDTTLADVLPLFSSANAAFKNVFTAANIKVTANAKSVACSTSIPATIANTTCAIKPTATTTTVNGVSVVSYRLVLPAGVTTVDLGYLPAGRLVMDVRRFDTVDTMSSYGYGYFTLLPGAVKTLNAGDLAASLGATQSINF